MLYEIIATIALSTTPNHATEQTPEQKVAWCESLADLVLDLEIQETSQVIKLRELFRDKRNNDLGNFNEELLYYSEIVSTRTKFEQLHEKNCSD